MRGPPVKEEGCTGSWMRGRPELRKWWSLEWERVAGSETERGEVLSHGRSSPGLGEVEGWGCGCSEGWTSPSSDKEAVLMKAPSSGVSSARVVDKKRHSPPAWIARVLNDELSSARYSSEVFGCENESWRALLIREEERMVLIRIFRHLFILPPPSAFGLH
jgi:hypothetical protein